MRWFKQADPNDPKCKPGWVKKASPAIQEMTRLADEMQKRADDYTKSAKFREECQRELEHRKRELEHRKLDQAARIEAMLLAITKHFNIAWVMPEQHALGNTASGGGWAETPDD